MKLFLLFVLSLAATLVSFLGEARADIVRAYLLNPEMRYERAASQNQENVKPFNISLGYQRTRWSALLEFSQYKTESESGNYFVGRTHQEITACARYHIFAWTFTEGRQTIQGYGGVGAGGFKETLTTIFQNESRKDTGEIKFVSGLAAGAEYSARLGERFLFVTAIEGRALVSSELDPNPMWSAVLRIGLGMFL